MKKPEMACVIGSATLAPIAAAMPWVAGAVLGWLLNIDIDWPSWLKVSFIILGIPAAAYLIRGIYRWLFWHCRKAINNV